VVALIENSLPLFTFLPLLVVRSWLEHEKSIQGLRMGERRREKWEMEGKNLEARTLTAMRLN